MKDKKTGLKETVQQILAKTYNRWYYFNETENGKQVRKRRCLETMLVQRLEEKEVWVFIKE